MNPSNESVEGVQKRLLLRWTGELSHKQDVWYRHMLVERLGWSEVEGMPAVHRQQRKA